MRRIFSGCCCLVLLLFCGCVATNQLSENQQKQAEVHFKLGVSHLQSQNPTMALKELLIAVKHDPQNSTIQATLANAYQLKKAFPEAERHYLKALEYSDNEPRYQNNLASLYLDMQQWDKAIEYFDKAASNLLFLSPYIALTGKGFAFFKKNDLTSAELAYQDAITIAPQYARAHFLLSQVYQAQGRTDLELRSLERAVDLVPQYIEAHYQLGVLLSQQNQPEKAIKHLKKVIELAPDSDWGQKATDVLRSLEKS